ncbi:MAG: radical SAM protein [Thermoprotei archaeon]|nr:MAG: radical SAM protein [Thermoprotei archaeon]
MVEVRPKVVWIGKDLDTPLLGHIAFGLIDRGTNLIQVRPTSLCPLSCIFCSTDAGPSSYWRIREYLVDLDLLLESFKSIIKYKEVDRIEAHIDTVGDPFTYPKLVELVQGLKEFPQVSTISLQTHGFLMNEQILDELNAAGLSRINLSIDSLDPSLASDLAGNSKYNVERIKQLAEYIVESTDIDLLLAPVWLPGLNDDEIPKIIEYALRIGAGKYWPPLGIQKYEIHKFGRKPKRIKPMSWTKFFTALSELEKRYHVKLILEPEDFGIFKCKMLPVPFRVGERVKVRIVDRGWLRYEWLGVARSRIVTIVGVPHETPPIGLEMIVRIVRTKHNIIIAKPL